MGFLLLLVLMVELFLKSRGSQIVNIGFMIMSLGGLSGDHVRDIRLWIRRGIYQRLMEPSYWSRPLEFVPIAF